jgi:hypothetical protein
MSPAQHLQICTSAEGKLLSPGQKRFNTLVRQIEESRQTLAQWHENTTLYAQAHHRRVQPLADKCLAMRSQWAFALDTLLDQTRWTPQERTLLSEQICRAASELLETQGNTLDPALQALFDKHSEHDFETEQQHARLATKDMMEAMTGFDLGEDTDICSDQELMRRMQEALAQQAANAQEHASHRNEAPRSKRANAGQKKQEAQAQLTLQSVREVFRKLASALHPDREIDPIQRDAKTALMQKVNQAYAARDLLTLLELQLQIEQIDATYLAGASTERLKHYNKVLTEQLAELRSELERAEMQFKARFSIEHKPGSPSLNPTQLLRLLDISAKNLRAELAHHHQNLCQLSDKAAVKNWLKHERKRAASEALFGFF